MTDTQTRSVIVLVDTECSLRTAVSPCPVPSFLPSLPHLGLGRHLPLELVDGDLDDAVLGQELEGQLPQQRRRPGPAVF